MYIFTYILVIICLVAKMNSQQASPFIRASERLERLGPINHNAWVYLLKHQSIPHHLLGKQDGHHRSVEPLPLLEVCIM